MSDTNEKEGVEIKVNSFVEKNKKGLIIALSVLVVLLVAYIIGFAVGRSNKEKNLATIDTITYKLVDDSMNADEAELKTRRNTALEELQPLVSKSGIVGARANMLAADIAYQLEDNESSASYWAATAKKAKGTYIEPIAYYNLGVCNEDMDNLEEAAANYKLAADNEEFVLNTHAKFSYGRVLEAQGNFADAVAAYTELNDSDPNDAWAQLAKTRILTLQAEGKAE